MPVLSSTNPLYITSDPRNLLEIWTKLTRQNWKWVLYSAITDLNERKKTKKNGEMEASEDLEVERVQWSEILATRFSGKREKA